MRYYLPFLIIMLLGIDAAVTAIEPQEIEETKEAKSAFVIHTFIQKNRIEPSLSGGYGRFLRYLQKEITIPIDVRPNYLSRALKNMENEKTACFFPAVPHQLGILNPKLRGIDYQYSLPVDTVRAYIFRRKTAPAIKSVQDLKGHPIGLLRNLTKVNFFGPLFKELTFITVTEDRQNINMLKRGRVQYALGWTPDTQLIAESLAFNDLTFDPEFKLFEATTHVACTKDPASDAVMTELNTQIKKLHQTGLIKFILSKHAEPVSYGNPAVIQYPLSGIDFSFTLTEKNRTLPPYPNQVK